MERSSLAYSLEHGTILGQGLADVTVTRNVFMSLLVSVCYLNVHPIHIGNTVSTVTLDK